MTEYNYYGVPQQYEFIGKGKLKRIKSNWAGITSRERFIEVEQKKLKKGDEFWYFGPNVNRLPNMVWSELICRNKGKLIYWVKGNTNYKGDPACDTVSSMAIDRKNKRPVTFYIRNHGGND